MTKDFLFELCSSPSVSGSEFQSTEILKKYFSRYTDSMEQDKLGSSIFVSEGCNGKKIMLSAHADEIGLMVKGIHEGGFLSIASVGGINPASLVAQDVTVYGRKEIFGAIGIKPPHVTPASERTKSPKIKDLYIDTGYSKEELDKIVSIGDLATVRRSPVSLQGTTATSKAFDDKAGVAVMYETAKELKKISHKSSIYYAATVMEETGCLGAGTSSYKINPDVAIIIDVGFGLTPGMPEETPVLGKGPVVAIGGRLNPKLTRKFIDVCKEYNIAIQYEACASATGTDTEKIQINREGVPCVLLSIPLRYMHTSVEVIDIKDVENAGRAIARFINEIDNADLEEILCF